MPAHLPRHRQDSLPTRWAEGVAHPRNVLALSFTVVPTLCVFAGKSTVPTLLAVTVLALPGALLHGWRPSRPSLATLALAAAASAWVGIASLWSFDPGDSLFTGVRVLSLIAVAWVLSDIAVRVPSRRDPDGRRLARCAVIGLAVAAAVLLIEMLSDMGVKSAVTGLWEDDPVSGSEANRGGTFILIALWLVLPLSALATARPRMVAIGLFVLSCSAVAVAESGTNQVALLTGAAFFGLAWLGRPVRLGLWASAVAVGLVAMPWLAQAMYDAGLHQIDALATSIQHRFFIWNHVSDWALERPWTGWGYDSSSAFSNRGVEPWPGYSSVIPLHPHNAALQIWLELGVVGVSLASALVLRIVQGTESAGVRWAPWLGAAAMSALVAANLGYGIWQTQWIAALAWLGCYGRLAVALAPGAWRPRSGDRPRR